MSQMSLHQRPVSKDKAISTSRKLEAMQFDSPPKAASSPLQMPKLSGHVYLLLSVVAITVLTFGSSRIPNALPDAYILCSRDGHKIYTVDESNSQTQCIAVHNAYIVDRGSLQDVKRRWNNPPLVNQGSGTSQNLDRPPLSIRFIDRGSIVVPGLSDSHAHILEYGGSQQLPLDGAKSIKDTVARVRNYILSNPDVYNDSSKFITGGGWDHTSWPTTGWPTAADLDSDPIIRGRPIVLQSKDCHALWVSSKALEKSLPFPEAVEGGIIFRDDFGAPTGVLLDNAQELVKQPPLTESDLLKRFSIAIRDAVSFGLTSIHDAGLDPISLDFFKRQAERGHLPIRIYGMTFFDESGEYWGNRITPLTGMGDGRLSARSVKIFADGALRTGGAALYEPYADNPSTNGFMRLPPDVLFDVIPRFLRDGWQVNVHAIGDRANGIVLDAFEAALNGTNVTALRPRLEHAQIMTRDDMARLGRLGVIASIQPAHVISDMWYAQDRLGPERVKGLYAFRSLIDSGARITLGSDFPVEAINPLAGFYAAITRVSPDGKSPHGPGGWFPEQRLTREEALRGMTIDPAYASFTESMLGSLVPGKRADYVVLSRDIMSIPVNQILDTKVVATVIDGKPIHGKI